MVPEPTTRRRMLALSGVAAVSGIAGCADNGDDEDADDPDDTADGVDTNDTDDADDDVDDTTDDVDDDAADDTDDADEDDDADDTEADDEDETDEDGYSLTVTVEDEDEEPIDGATVWLEGDAVADDEDEDDEDADENGDEDDEDEDDAADDEDDEEVEDADDTDDDEDADDETDSEHEDETDDDGQVEFTGLEDGEYTVVASAEDYGQGEEDVEIDGADEEVTVTLEEGEGDLAVETSYNSREEYSDPGDSFDDFEDLSDWEIVEGNAEEDEDTVFTGSQSVRMYTEEEEENLVIERDLEGDNPDFTDLDFSMAVRTTTPNNIAIEMRFLDIYGSSRTYQLRSVAYDANDPGWFRISPGVVSEDEYPPEMDFLDRLEIRVHNTGEEAEVWVDDIRTHEKPDTGYVMLVWDDGTRDFYEGAAEIHDEYDVNAVQSIVRQWTIDARDDVMTRQELLERQEAGDQIIGHGTHTPFADMDPEEVENSIETDKQFKVNAGFEGANFLTFPHNSFNDTVLEIVAQYYYAGGFNQAGDTNLTGAYGFDPLVLPRTIGYDLETCRNCVDLAAEYNQVTVLNFHAFDLDNTLDEGEYGEFIEYIDETDNVEVVTFDELWEMRTENH